MNFFSLGFLLFFFIILLLVKKSRTAEQRNTVLLLASWLFYASWDWRLLGLLMLLSFTTYWSGKIAHLRSGLLLGVLFPLFTLGCFKYLDFFVGSFARLFALSDIGALHILLPLGISFYSFLAISYVLDVRRGKIAMVHDFRMIALYVSFFPTVVSGPITKARELLPQFASFVPISMENFRIGLQIFLLGCLKKFVLADNMGVFVDEVYRTPLVFDSATVWLAVVTYSLQLYFDFSGYSDMAIGIARSLGFRLTENFNMPYLSRSMTEFWKRWHISLSSWLQEYLYFSLGGNRKGSVRTYMNLLITMLLCGLWHGAAWHFVLWGGTHGVLLTLHRLYRETLGKSMTIPAGVSVMMTFFSATMCWVLFRAVDMENMCEIFSRLFLWENAAVSHMFVWAWIGIAVLAIMMFATIRHREWQAQRPMVDLTTFQGFFVFCMATYFLLVFMYTGNNPFVYANF